MVQRPPATAERRGREVGDESVASPFPAAASSGDLVRGRVNSECGGLEIELKLGILKKISNTPFSKAS
jgi:hypothetical protein